MRWRLAHEDHAIERVSVTFQFAEPVPSKPWQRLLNAATLRLPENGFNSTSDDVELNLAQLVMPGGGPFSQGGALVIGPGGAIIGAGQPGAPPSTGRTFRVVGGNEVREEVSLHRHQVVYSTTLYDRWTSYKERMLALLSPLLDQSLPVVNLGTIKLEYWDRFVFMEAAEGADYRDLLRSGSRHLPSFPFDRNDLWHSHIGYFTQPGLSAKRLLNLNIDVMDLVEAQNTLTAQAPQARRSVGIYSMAQDTIAPDRTPASAAETQSTLDEMHAVLKETLADVVTDETAERISLKGKIAE